MVVFSHPYKSSEWHLWNNRRSTQKRTKLSVSRHSWDAVFHITFPEEQFPKLQEPLKLRVTAVTTQSYCSEQKYCTAMKLCEWCAWLTIAHNEAICFPHTPRIELTALTETQLMGIKLQEYVNAQSKASHGRRTRTESFLMLRLPKGSQPISSWHSGPWPMTWVRAEFLMTHQRTYGHALQGQHLSITITGRQTFRTVDVCPNPPQFTCIS